MADQEALFLKIQRAQAGDEEAMAALITENTPLIWSVARRFFGRGTDPEDLFQLGSIGMLKAISGFDPSYGTMFSTYAVPKIAGEIRRFLRDDGLIKVSRSVKSAGYRIRKIREELAARLGREPFLSELSEASGLSAEEIAEVENAGVAADSFQRETNDDGLTLEGMVGTGVMEEGIIDRLMVRSEMEKLPENERMVLYLRYFKGMTQDRSAKVLQISQVQVSRLERRALSKLRQKIS